MPIPKSAKQPTTPGRTFPPSHNTTTQAVSKLPPLPPEPPAHSPLWLKVKSTMDKEEYFRQKSKAAEIQIKGLALEIAALEKDLSAKDKALDLQKRKHKALAATLKAAKHRADQLQHKLAQQEAKPRGQPNHQLRRMLQDSRHQTRRYRTALAAAFKLVDDLKDKTTFTQLLEQTDCQLARGSSAPARQTPGRTMPPSPLRFKVERSSDDEDSEADGDRGDSAMTYMHVKHREDRSVEDEDEDDADDTDDADDDEEPLSRARNLGSGIRRKIIPDE